VSGLVLRYEIAFSHEPQSILMRIGPEILVAPGKPYVSRHNYSEANNEGAPHPIRFSAEEAPHRSPRLS